MKIQILQGLLNSNHHFHSAENKTVINIMIVEKHPCVISTASFFHCGLITRYLVHIMYRIDNITSSIIKKKVSQPFFENYINSDQWSLITGDSQLVVLAIDGILIDYILPTFTETWTTQKNVSDWQKGDF